MGFKDRYTLPESVTEGVDITLEDVTFKVALPTQYNRKFQRSLGGELAQVARDEGGASIEDLPLVLVFEAQLRAFLRDCVLSVDGLDYEWESFYQDYPEAADDLFAKAMEIASAKTDEADEQVGKPEPSSSGKKSGKARKASTPNSQNEVESLPRASGQI